MDNRQIIKDAVRLSGIHCPSAKYAVWIDFSRSADEHRFFLVNVEEREIEYSWYTSHGSASGALNKAIRFSNVPESKMSSQGFYKTAETYSGKYGLSLKLDGQEHGVNSNVRRRSIVIHRSQYVSESYMESNKYPGRSWGCITLDPAKADEIIEKIKGGSMVYVYSDK